MGADLSSSPADNATTATAGAAKLPAADTPAELGPQQSLSPKSVVLKAGTATLDPSSANASEAGDAGATAFAFLPVTTTLQATTTAAGSPHDQHSLHAQLTELALADPYATPSFAQPIAVFGGAELAAIMDPNAAANVWAPSSAATWADPAALPWADPAALPWAPSMDMRNVALWSVCGCFFTVATDPSHTLWLMGALAQASLEMTVAVWRNEALPAAMDLAVDPHGNKVLQWFLDATKGVPTEVQAEAASSLAAVTAGSLLPMAHHPYACRVVQALLEVSPESQVAAARELLPSMWDLASCPHGNHVLAKCIKTMPQTLKRSAVKELANHVHALSKERYGVRLVLAVLEHCALTNSHLAVVATVVGLALELASHEFGKHLVQHILQHGPFPAKIEIAALLARQAPLLAQHADASRCLDAVLLYCGKPERDAVVQALLASGATTLSAVFRCPYGNFVVQHALQCTTHRLQRALLDAMLREASDLRTSRHGKHVARKAHSISRGLAAKRQLASVGRKQAAGSA